MRETTARDPLASALDYGLGLCSLFYIQIATLFHSNHGSRAFPMGLKIFATVLVWAVALFWGGFALVGYASLYSLINTIHRIHHLTRKEQDLPHSKYDGEPWALSLIQNQEFSKQDWPVWWPDDMEVMLKWLIQPALCVLVGYLFFDSGETRLGLYLIITGIAAFVFMCYRHSKNMDVYYEEVDERNRQRYLQEKQQGKNPKNYGFVSKARTTKAEPAKNALSEEDLAAKIRQIQQTTLKANAQAPPTAPAAIKEDQAIGTQKPFVTSSPPPPSPIPTVETQTATDPGQTDGITVFSDEENETSNTPATQQNFSDIFAKLKPTGTNSQSDSGSPKTATATIVKPVKPPKSKIYSNK